MAKKLLTLIFFLAVVLRFWNLGTFPDAIDEDEMALGYNAFSLVKNGTDEYGNKLPTYFESAGDYKYGLYSYLDTIPVAIFGLNPTTTRSIAALFGSLSVIVVYFLALEILNDKRFALLSSFVLAVSPTHIHFSRVAYNNILGAFFATLSILFLIRYFKRNSLKQAVLAFIFFLGAIYSYQAYRIFMPVSFILLSILYLKSPIINSIKKNFLISFLAVALVYVSLINPQSRARTQDFSILTEKPKIIENQSEDGVAGAPLFETRLFHNKYISFMWGFSKRYFSYFDPVFLFVETSASTQRHSTPEMGLLYVVEAPLILFGLLTLFLYVKNRERFILPVLLAASPIAASLVVESRSTTRSVVLVYALTFIISLGIYYLTSFKKYSKLILMLVGIVYFGNLYYFSHQYLIHKVYHHPWSSDVGLKEMVFAVNELSAQYENIVMSHGHYIPYLFYNKVDPKEFIAMSEFNESGYSGGVRVKKFGKINFNMPYECPDAGKINTLYVCFGYKVPKNARLVKVIRFKDDQPAIILVDFGKKAEKSLPDKVEYSSEEDIRFENGIIPINYEIFWPKQS